MLISMGINLGGYWTNSRFTDTHRMRQQVVSEIVPACLYSYPRLLDTVDSIPPDARYVPSTGEDNITKGRLLT